jgi:acyl-CoA synthetase (AMP-forming)/AMP-acid ligase II
MTLGVNLASLLFDHPFGDDQGLLYGVDDEVTAGGARVRSAALAEELLTSGIAPGQSVAVQLPNGPNVVIAMTAIWRAGAVFIPVNPRLTENETADVIRATRPAVRIGPDGMERLSGTRTFEAGTAFILWTSGTTGAPKPILHTHEGYLELIDRVLGPLRAGSVSSDRAPSPNLIPVSLSLNAGIYNALFGLRAGAPLVIMDAFDVSTFAHLVARFQIRSTVLPPAALTMLTDAGGVTDLEPLKYVRSITAPLSPLQARRFTNKFGVFVLNGYGQAEIGEVVGWTAADAKAHPEKVGAAGRAHPGVDLKLMDGPVALGVEKVGELLVRPPSMAAGYASDDELADRLDPEGFLHTGDLARIDADGFVWIEGRMGDLINRGGNKVFPEHVEEVLRLSPAVGDAAVVGIPDDRLGEVPVAFVVTTGDVEDAELEALCRLHLTAYKVPVLFVRVATLPRSEAGKVLRRQLVAGYRTSLA